MDAESLALPLQTELLRIARVTLTDALLHGRVPPGRPHNETLLAPGAAFVTLHRNGTLRGCIGTVEAQKPLYLVIQEMAVAAATRDPRFESVTADELCDIEIEISVLSQPTAINGPDDLLIGRDGVMVVGRGKRGVLLPQVAVEHGWDAVALLENTCGKAELPPGAWRDSDVQCMAFSATIFAEKANS